MTELAAVHSRIVSRRAGGVAKNVAHLHGNTLGLARLGNNLSRTTVLTEKNETINGAGDKPISTIFLPVPNPTAPLLPMPPTIPVKITPAALKTVRLKWATSIAPAAAIRPGIQRMPAKAAARKIWLKPVERVCSIALRSINVHHLPTGPELTDALETTDVFINNPRFRCS
jgi:hypothetical protein